MAPGLSKVATGEYCTALLVDGTVYSLGGSNTYAGITQDSAIPPLPIDVPSGTLFHDTQGGLHQSLGVDTTGHVWTWGDNLYGQEGNGVDHGAPTNVLPFEIMQDDLGNPFDSVVAVTAGNEVNGALKADSSVWIWGASEGGLVGDGLPDGGDTVYPTQVPLMLPAGVSVRKLLLGETVMVLDSTGTVWVWGGGGAPNALGTGNDNYTSPQAISGLPANVVDITGGTNFFYALTSDGDLYGWGEFGLNLGLGQWTTNSCYNPQPVPVLLTGDGGALGLPLPVAQVAADTLTTHVILTDGSLWGWGDDAMGEVGDGQELDFATYPTPYAWDFGQCELMVMHPIRIVPSVSNFTRIYSNTTFDFYDYAQTSDGGLYSWGRNKSGNLGNGIIPANSHQAAAYPNSWDVTTPTLVDPLQLQQAIPTNSPYCIANPDAGNCWCTNGKTTC